MTSPTASPVEGKAFPQEGKIFVGGLNWITTTESLRSHFERFGNITDCVIMKDRNTQQPRGFGFVTFADADVAEEVAAQKQVMVDGRSVEVKRAVPRGDDEQTRQRPGTATAIPARPLLSTFGVKRVAGGSISTKIFVGGISWSTTDEEFLKHFERYGTVAAAHVMKYRDGTPRGFGYVTFLREDSVDKAVASRNNIGGRDVDVKRAVSKEEMELVKTDPVNPQGMGIAAGLPTGRGMGVVPGGMAAGLLNPHFFQRASGLAPYPGGVDRGSDLPPQHQSMASTAAQGHLPDMSAGLLSGFNQRYLEAAEINQHNLNTIAALTELLQQASLNSVSPRQQQLFHAISSLSPTALNQIQRRLMAENHASVLHNTSVRLGVPSMYSGHGMNHSPPAHLGSPAAGLQSGSGIYNGQNGSGQPLAFMPQMHQNINSRVQQPSSFGEMPLSEHDLLAVESVLRVVEDLPHRNDTYERWGGAGGATDDPVHYHHAGLHGGIESEYAQFGDVNSSALLNLNLDHGDRGDRRQPQRDPIQNRAAASSLESMYKLPGFSSFGGDSENVSLKSQW